MNQTLLDNSSLPIRRTFKDSVFRLVFQDKKALLSLYNALNGTEYTDADALEIEMLEHAIYMGISDDVAFLLDFSLNIYEQQASMNPNMPLRDLLYISSHFSKFLKNKSIYSSRLVKIPVPQFVVFYNGTSEQPERQILRLSDAYLKETADPQLELKVLMLNINLGHNRELLEKCQTLREYSLFVDTMRRFSKIYPIEEAAEKAVDECIQNHILEDFLSAQRAEVIEMSIFEYNHEIEMKKLRESEFEYGKDVGFQDGLLRGRESGLQEGLSRGRESGLQEGLSRGRESGKAEEIIHIYQEIGLSRAEIHDKLKNKLSIDDDTAEQYLEQFWNEMPLHA